MPSAPPENLHSLLATMKRAGAALRENGVDYMLGGGLAIWARGGPPTDHDVDLFLREEDAERALHVLADAGFRPERPPEHWLLQGLGRRRTSWTSSSILPAARSATSISRVRPSSR